MMSRSSRKFGRAIDLTFRGTGNILGSAADHFMGPGFGNTFRTSGKIAGTVLGKVGGASIAGATGAARLVQDRKMQRSVDAIKAAVDAENYDRLLPLARDFAERNPEEPMGYAWQALALIGMERYEQALAATARAVQVGFDESEARMLRAEAYTGMADYGGVIRELTPLVSNPEVRASALVGRASALLEIGDLEQALDDANQAIAASPDEVAYVTRGDVYRVKGELAECIDDYNRADRLRPNSVTVLEKRAEVYDLLGKTGEANRDRAAAEEARGLDQSEKVMTEARAFLAHLREDGVPIKVAPNGRDLEVRGGGLKGEPLATLYRLKPQLLELLRAE
jgi:tetratricopeptide (TPR) repeat protein